MFEQTFSFWRRLVGKKPAVGASAVAGNVAEEADERRLWVRYPAQLTAHVQPATGLEEKRVLAQVRDISRGGANLLVDQPFETGQLLSVELPGRAGAETQLVLACVVRAARAGDKWELGCVFSRELPDEDLEGFGAKRVRHPPTDKRIWMRFPASVRAAFQTIGDAESRTYTAQVINLSASGVGLLVNKAVEAGALLSLDLVGNKQARTILACVVHVTARPGDEWALGCNFIRQLSEADLKALI